MYDNRIKDDVRVGMMVKISLTSKHKSSKLIEGEVFEILSEEPFNENGIEVELVSGYIGNVKEILTQNNEELTESELRVLIEKHETYNFELKSTFRYDIELSHRLGKEISSEYLRRKIVEEVSSFMNCDGGILCIGVDDQRNVLGLENDYKLFPKDKEPSDELRNQIKQALIDYLGDNIIHSLIRIGFVEINSKNVCLIYVDKSPEPIFVKIRSSCRIDSKDKSMEIWKCWIRADNGIREVDFKSFMKHWELKNKK